MISSLWIYRASGPDPFENLAREQVLLEQGPADGLILYLWQNENTVVIGRNQNAFKECRVSLLDEEGGKLARRLSGGGAVFHDKGNLNFTFLLPRADFDIRRQLEVICRACRAFGIPAEISGRNDLTAAGYKFSGNAFYKSGDRAYHHGTLLLHADMAKLGRYLSPPKAKLEAKGVDSVRSRVTNLRSFVPALTCDAMGRQLVRAAEKVYGLTAQELVLTAEQEESITRLTEHYASREWRFGAKVPASFSCEKTFPWGTVSLELLVEGGIITHAGVFTDAMEWELSQQLQQALEGREFSRSVMQESLLFMEIQPDIREDISRMLAEQEI
ncbi:MAG: lipoate--protein ligase [Clostridia bacterium]|nr:lipoate--protein ligase [Clostridia bacterium]